MKVVFLISSAWSHVNPTLPLVRELTRRGPAVTYFADERFREAVERLGAAFSAVGPEPPAPPGPQLPDGPPTLRRALARRHGLAAALTRIPDVAGAVRSAGADVVVLDPTTGWHGLARSLGVPVATVTPSFFYTHESPLIASGLPTPADRRSRALRAADAELQRVQAALRASENIPPTDPDRLFTGPADLKLAATYRELQPDGDAFRPPRFVYLGAALTCRAEPELGELDALRSPLAYVSMGSAAAVDSRLAHTVLDAFADGAWSVVFAGLDEGAVTLPAWATGRPVVPQLEVLERAAVFVTHGGMNSVVEAIAHAVPMLLLPATPEQSFVARRVHELGLGVAMARANVDRARLRDTVQRLHHDRRVARALERARPLARDSGGVALAAETIVGLAARSPARYTRFNSHDTGSRSR